MGRRGPRRMRSAVSVAEHWQHRGDSPFVVDVDTPQCFGCRLRVSDWRTLQRAHLVDRALDGLDGEQNLAMLCPRCHRVMPVFEAGEGEAAIEWVLRRPNVYMCLHGTHGSLCPVCNPEDW